MIETRCFELAGWQADAVAAWERGDDRGPHRGTLEIVTGGGKTLIALACIARAAATEPKLRFAVVVPTEALARQWRAAIVDHTTLAPAQVGLLGAGGTSSFDDCIALVAVLNTASERLPSVADDAKPLFLVVDECHRAGAPSFSKVLKTRARFRLGLSATPDREEFDDAGEPLSYDEQLVGRSLGSVVFRFTLRDARERGWLPDYDIHHHGISLGPEDRTRYEAASRRVDDIADQLRQAGVDSGRAQQLQRQGGEVGQLARSYIAATAMRKDLLYRAPERRRVTQQLVREAVERGKGRILLFHERVDEAVELAGHLNGSGLRGIGLEHSRLPASERVAVMESFRSGELSILVSVKSLVEGIDVPEADVGISVASTSSVRQRVQSLGRVLRRQFDESAPRKHAEMHVLYVAETVDEFIYAKEDWSDLTGEGANHYWHWLFEGGPEPLDGPPATPRPTEEQEWDRLGREAPGRPERWLGAVAGQEYSVDTMGTVTNASGSTIANPQDAAAFVEEVRGRPGGRFRVTPTYRLVLVWGEVEGESAVLVAGQLAEPFDVAEELEWAVPVEVSTLKPGDEYPGPLSKARGTFKISQKRGGVIERRTKGGFEFASTVEASPSDLVQNAERVLAAWRALFERGITFHVSDDDLAWYAEGSKRRFLAAVPNGFAWPSNEGSDEQ